MAVLPTLTREQLAKVFKDPRLLLAFDAFQRQIADSIPTSLTALSAPRYIVATLDPSVIPNALVLTAGTGLTAAQTPGVITLSLQAVNPSPGTYALATVTVDAEGRATSVAAGPTLGALALQSAVTVAQLPTPPTFSVYLTAAQSVASGVFTKVLFDTAEWNVSSGFDIATNHRFTPNQAGKYLLTTGIGIGGSAITNDLIVSIYKNGAEYRRGVQIAQAVGGGVHSVGASVMVSANGTTDYFEVFVFQDSGVAQALSTGAVSTWFQGAFISP